MRIRWRNRGHQHRGEVRLRCRRSNANTDCNRDGYRDCNGNAYSYGDCYGYRDCDCYGYAYAYGYGNSDAHSNPASADAKAAAYALPSADAVRWLRIISD